MAVIRMKRIGTFSARRHLLQRRCGVLVLAGLLGCAARVAWAQQRIIRPEDYKRGVVPKKPEHRAAPAELPERRIDIADDKTILLKSLLGVRFVRSAEEVIKDAAGAGIEIKDIELLDNEEFRKVIQPYLGKPVTMRSISKMVRDTIVHYRSKDRPVVDVFVPEQEITKGVVQLMVVEARVGQVKVEGLKWFGEKNVRAHVRLQSGDVIYASSLLADVDYINKNPFRFVRPVLQPGKEFGTTDILLDAKDRFPMRFYIGYEDTGSRETDLGRLFTGFNIGNLFDRGHEVGYQYTTNTHVHNLGIHSAYWRIPLMNRDTLAFFGNWAGYDFSMRGADQHSDNWNAHVRYITPLPSSRGLAHELEFGVDFRRAENDIQVGGNTVYDDFIDVGQLAFQYGGRWKDRMGNSSFVLNGYWSPFNQLFSNHQSKQAYEVVRSGTRPEYIYGHASVERLWVLPEGWGLFNRVTAQLSNQRLPPTEQLGLGGYNTVRGFDERDVNSDQGLMATMELRTPRLDLGIKDKAKNIPSFLQFLAFCDYGHARNRGSRAFEEKTEDMLSVGAGLRLRISDNLSVRVDYGYKLEDVQGSESGDGRFHIFVLLSY